VNQCTSSEDPKSTVHWTRQGQNQACSHLEWYVCYMTHTLWVVFPPKLVSPFLDKDKHTLKTQLLIIRGKKRNSQNSELSFTNGQKGVSWYK
jgi:hypothetical protein